MQGKRGCHWPQRAHAKGRTLRRRIRCSTCCRDLHSTKSSILSCKFDTLRIHVRRIASLPHAIHQPFHPAHYYARLVSVEELGSGFSQSRSAWYLPVDIVLSEHLVAGGPIVTSCDLFEFTRIPTTLPPSHEHARLVRFEGILLISVGLTLPPSTRRRWGLPRSPPRMVSPCGHVPFRSNQSQTTLH